MRADKGYLLPNNPTPLGLRCIKLWIPDDQRYLEAFAGQYHELGTWLAWEKDGTNRGSHAAQTWKNAIDYTYENGWIDACGEENEQMDCCEELTRRIEYLEQLFGTNGECEMSNCCCNGGSNNTVNVTVITPPSELPYDPTPSDTPPTLPPANSYKCGMAHYIAYVIRSILINTFSWSGDYGGWSAQLESFFGWLAGWLPGAGLIYSVYVSVIGWLAGIVNTEPIVSAYNEAESTIVCAMYSAETASEAWDNVKTVIDGALPGMTVARLVVKAIASLMPYDALFAASTIATLPASFRARTCTCDEIPEELPGGYVVLPVLDADTSASDAPTHENVGGNTWRIAGNNNNVMTVSPDLTDQGYTWGGTAGNAAGFRIVKVSGGNVGGNIFPPDGFCFHDSINPIATGTDYRGGLTDIDGWIAEGDTEVAFLVDADNTRFQIKCLADGVTADLQLWVVIAI